VDWMHQISCANECNWDGQKSSGEFFDAAVELLLLSKDGSAGLTLTKTAGVIIIRGSGQLDVPARATPKTDVHRNGKP
jgi:hypothetical protein